MLKIFKCIKYSPPSFLLNNKFKLLYSFKIAYDTKSIFDAIKAEVSNFQPNIDYLIEQAKEEKETAQAEATASLEAYKEVIPTVEGLSTEDISIISQTVAQAEEGIKNSKTASEIAQAIEKFETVMKNYENVRVAKSKKVTLDTLNSELENASEGLTSVINDAISAINKATTVEGYTDAEGNEINGIEDIFEEITQTVEDIKSAQDEAEKILIIYGESIDETSMTTSYKGIVKNELAKYRQEIDKATTAEDIEKAVSSFEAFLQDNRYNSVAKIAEKKILQAHKDSAVAKLNEYAEYNNEEVKTMVKDYIEKVNDAETVDAVDTIMNDIETTKGAISTLEDKIAEIEATLEAQQIAYAAAYKNAVAELDEYTKYLESDTTITEDQKKDVQEAIYNTKSNMTRVTTSGEVYSSMKTFRDYINTYYSDLSDEVGNFAFINARNVAITTLNEYASKTGVSEEVKAIITEAIEKMNIIEDNDENATADNINAMLQETQVKIAAQELSEEKSEAIKRLTKYVNVDAIMEEAKSNGASYDNEATIKKEVQDLAKDTMEKVQKATKKAEMPNVDEIIKQITDKLQIKSEQEIIDEDRTIVLDKIKEYTQLSKETGDSSLESEIQSMITAIKEATSEEELNSLEDDFDKYIDEHYSLLDKKKDGIAKLSDYTNEEKADTYADDSAIQNIVKESIQNVKKAKTLEKVQDIIAEAEKEIEERKTEIKDFVEEKDKMEGILTGTAITEADSTVGKNEETGFVLADYVGYDDIVTTTVSSYIKEVEKVQYDSIVAKLGEEATEEQIKEAYNKAFEDIIEEALKIVEAYVKQDKDEATQEVTEYHTPEITEESFFGVNEDGSKKLELKATLKQDLSNTEKNIKETAIGGSIEAVALTRESVENIKNAKTANGVDEIVTNAELAIDIKTARVYLENITESKTYKALSDLNKEALYNEIKADKKDIDKSQNHEDFINKIDNAKADLGAKIKELQQGEKEVVDNAIDTNGTGSTGLGSKTYENLQSNIELNDDGTITGTLNKVEYQAYWGVNGAQNPLKKGYYLGLKLDKGTADKIYVQKSHRSSVDNVWTNDTEKEVTDEYVIVRIPEECIDNNTIKKDCIKLTVSLKDNSNNTIAINSYDLSTLTLK